jgi:hypothetical protein
LGTLVLSAAILGVSVFLTRKQSKLISKFARQSTPKLETLSDYELSQLDVYLLRSLRYTRKEKELARATGVDPQVITHKLNLLYTLGYVTENTELTEKGYDVINRPDSGSRQPEAPVASAEQPTQPTVGLTRQRQDHATSNKTSKYVK